MDLSNILHRIGLESETWISVINNTVTVMLIMLAGYLAYIIVKKWLARFVIRLAERTPVKWDDLIFDKKFFSRLGMLIASIVVAFSVKVIGWEYTYIIGRFVSVWVTVAAVMFISTVMYGFVRVYESYSVSRQRPVRVFVQVVSIFMWCAAMIVVISIFTGKSMLVLLGGLTAFAAVLMLIFQDSILGFVAGIQLSANNMVRVGDWIVMPGRGVDGDVTEINLTTVKVQNWDKTITTIPTHKLVSESFTNWRGMEESKGRRIKRSVNIDTDTIRYLSDEDIQNLKQSETLREYIEQKEREIEEYNASHPNNLDARRMTNVGTFREYLESWLEKNPHINQEMTHMVRQLQPGPTGLPIEIYCFSAKQGWIDYENVQSDIFDHIYAVLPLFGLKAFQYTGFGASDQV